MDRKEDLTPPSSSQTSSENSISQIDPNTGGASMTPIMEDCSPSGSSSPSSAAGAYHDGRSHPASCKRKKEAKEGEGAFIPSALSSPHVCATSPREPIQKKRDDQRPPPLPLAPTTAATSCMVSSHSLNQEDARIEDTAVLDAEANDFFDTSDEGQAGGVLSWNTSLLLSSIQQMIPEKQTFDDDDPATPTFFPTFHHHHFFDSDEAVVEEEQRIRAAEKADAVAAAAAARVLVHRKYSAPTGAADAAAARALLKSRHLSGVSDGTSSVLEGKAPMGTTIPATAAGAPTEEGAGAEGATETKPRQEEGNVEEAVVDVGGDLKKEDSTQESPYIRIINSIAYPPYGVQTVNQKNLLFWGHSLPLYSIKDIPHWQKYNTAIRGSYRAFYDTSMTFKSLVGWHNESMNVWTHLIGFIFFIYLTHYLFANVIRTEGAFSPYLFQAPIFYYIFCLGCLGCTICSTLFHLFSGHQNGKLITLMGRIDFIGITLLIISSILPLLYVLLHCVPLYRNIYISAAVILGVLTSVACWTDAFYQNVYLRVGLFVGLGLSGAVPLVHILLIIPYSTTINSILFGAGLMGLLYLTGVFFYVARFPEAWFPSHFDCFLSSHQIWHYFVLLAALVHFCNCTSVYQIYTMSDGNC